MSQSVNAFYNGRMFQIEHSTSMIGPAHDPYAVDEFTVTFDKRTAKYYSDGLEKCRIELYENNIEFHSITWFAGAESKQTKLKAKLLFKQHVGMDFDMAESLFDEVLHEFKRSQDLDLEFINYAQG